MDHKSKLIEFGPEYQRQFVWTRSQKQLLIDSVLRGLDVGKVYLREVPDRNYQYEVVDGQQRLRSVLEFQDDGFPLPKDADKVGEEAVAGKTLSQLSPELRIEIQNYNISVAILKNFSDDDIEEMFLRLQNGTPLNAAEKRRALPSNLRNLVRDATTHDFFQLVGFTNKRYAHEDLAARIVHQFHQGEISDIKPASINKTYMELKDVDENESCIKEMNKAMSFVHRCFKDIPTSPDFKKGIALSVVSAFNVLRTEYATAGFEQQLGQAYVDFEAERIATKEDSGDDDDADPRLVAYTEALRNDSVPSLEYRHEQILRSVLASVPEMALKDKNRNFTTEQRFLIFHRSGGECQDCGAHIHFKDFEADHITPHSKGGLTQITNGQALCVSCNRGKGNGS